eukprot:COSAG02_NODE_50419_length_320_cov_1.149321_1_plen_77_part_01
MPYNTRRRWFSATCTNRSVAKASVASAARLSSAAASASIAGIVVVGTRTVAECLALRLSRREPGAEVTPRGVELTPP